MFIQALTCFGVEPVEKKLLSLIAAYEPTSPGPKELFLLRGEHDPTTYLIVAVFESKLQAQANEDLPETLQLRRSIEELTAGVRYHAYDVVTKSVQEP